MHEDHHSLRCWRVPRRRLLYHAAYRLSGGFKAGLWKEPSRDPTSEGKEQR
jgi:hypothetical protein